MQGTLCVERPFGSAAITVEIYEEAGALVCGVFNLSGHIRLPPKAWVREVRAVMALIEHEARKAGCTEVRVAGRDWSRVLPDYGPLPGPKNGLRKAL